MSSKNIQLKGKFELSEDLEIDHSYIAQITFGIESVTKKSDEAGGFEYTYHAKPEYGDIVMKNGEVIKLVDKKKQSVKLRQQLGFLAQERGLDPEKFYEEVMIKLRHHTLEVLDFLEGLNNV